MPCVIVLKNVIPLNHFRIIDHSKEGLPKVISSIGMKYTTAANVAEKTIKYIYPGIMKKSISSLPQLVGGEIENFSAFQVELKNRWQSRKIDANKLSQIILNYGSEAKQIIELGSTYKSDHFASGDSSCDFLRGETLFAVREEMAQKLSDVVLRRTHLGTAGYPLESSVREVSILMAKELGWDEAKRKSEIDEFKDYYPPFLTSKNLPPAEESERISN